MIFHWQYINDARGIIKLEGDKRGLAHTLSWASAAVNTVCSCAASGKEKERRLFALHDARHERTAVGAH